MKKGLLRQFPKQIREKILDHTIESYELRNVILKLIDSNPKFIIRIYLNDEALRDLLEEKDLEMIENRLKSALTYEWFYFEFKKAVKENMNVFVRDIAESFAFSILYENKYEYDEASGKIKDCGKFNIEDYDKLGDFMCDYGLMTPDNDNFLDIDPDNSTSHFDEIALNYLHKTLKQLLIDVYNKRPEEFHKFFGIERDYILSDMDFEEFEYELFEFFDTDFPMPDFNNPVGIAAELVSKVEEMDAKMLFDMGKDLVISKEK
ncbi:hypothetical protein [Acetivibrio straminisolvens]|uniref:Uncharacterized protein n=1 Tax=Acetivibrio straminisolvens JCM 21531 TaxID=1294263 RepID=W4V383_9FIRM|nr:hypothetical protein [Acetivibrio straminisolvens]GAE87666.1 hypothetical protein JCM21531_1054 [Acetivibrio straminisolvens JCM 21531]